MCGEFSLLFVQVDFLKFNPFYWTSMFQTFHSMIFPCCLYMRRYSAFFSRWFQRGRVYWLWEKGVAWSSECSPAAIESDFAVSLYVSRPKRNRPYYLLWLQRTNICHAADCQSQSRKLGSIPKYFHTVEPEGRQMKQCWIM